MSDPVGRLNAALEGRYAIERELGEGGMATVYLADDLKHERKVALKVLKPELAAVVGAERFLAEIKTTANLTHPHILPLHDSGEADGFLFYVMPHIEGESLRERIDRERQLPVDEAVKITTDLAEALDYAHRHKIIHRDIKPANILVHEGRPLIADFGIALAVGVAGGGRLTETGLSVGTPQAILGKIIAGKLPSVCEERASVPANVDAAIGKALEKLPADRFMGAQDFATALADPGFRHGLEVVAGGAAAAPWSRLTVAMTAFAAVATLVAGWSLLRPEPPQPVSRQVLSTEGWAGLEVSLGSYAAIAPDGSSMILPVRSSANDLQLALKMRGSTEITPIPGTEGGRDVVYSPDGQWIAYVTGSELFTRPLVGGAPVRLAEDADNLVVGLAWLDDGTIVYERINTLTSALPQIVRIPEDGGEPLVVFNPEEGLLHLWVHGLPDARGVLVIGCPTTNCRADVADLYVVDLQDLSSELILEQVARAWYTPTGHLVYVHADGALFAVPFDLGALEITGSAIPLFDRVRVPRGVDMQLAADGTVLYVEGSVGQAGVDRLSVVDLDGDEEALVLAPRNIGAVGWSPDGQSLVYSSEGNIYTYNVTLGTTPRQLTFEGTNVSPVFSPDGNRVAFRSTREGTLGADLFVKNLDDDSPERSVVRLEGNLSVTQWPSDTLIVFERSQRGQGDLWMVNLSDPDSARAAAYLTAEANLRSIVVSPDGTLAAYTSNESGQFEIYVRSFPDPGERTVASEGGGDVPFWSPDGNTLYYAREEGTGGTWMAARIQRNPVPVVLSRDSLFTGPYNQPFPGSGLHPDGDRWIVTQNVGSADPDDGAAEPERLIMITNFFEELRERVGN